MKRRIIKLGTTTLVTSLPSKWARQFGLKAGDYVEVQERNKDLLVSTEKAVAVSEKVLDCRKLTTRLVQEYLLAAYTLGYHTIEVLHEPRIREYKTKKMIKTTEFLQDQLKQFIGAEIIEQSDTRTVIKELATTSPEELLNTLRRVFLILKDVGLSLVKAMEEHDRVALSGIASRREIGRKFLIYFQRILNKQGYVDFSKTNSMFVLTDNLWLISAVYQIVAKDSLIFKRPYSKKAIGSFRMIVEAFNRYSELFFNYKPETAVELLNLREQIYDVNTAEKNKMSAEDATLYVRVNAIGAFLMHCVRMKFALDL